MSIKPMNDFVFIKKTTEEAVSKGGIILDS